MILPSGRAMKATNQIALVAAIALGATLASVQIASTQEQAKGVLEACEGDITKFCEGVTPGNGHIIACMYAYEDQISEGCSEAIVDFGDALDYLFHSARLVLEMCASDIEANCAGTQIGGGRILSCLAENSSTVSGECKTAVAEFAEKLAPE